MAYKTIKFRIKLDNSGKFVAISGSALAPKIGSFGLNPSRVSADINSAYNNSERWPKGWTVLTINTDNRTYTINFLPTMAGRILKIANRYKGTKNQLQPEFYLTTSQIKQIAIDHRPYMNNNVLSKLVSMTRGTLKSCGGAEQEDGTIIDDEIIGEPIIKHERKYKAVLTKIPDSLSNNKIAKEFTCLFNKYFLNKGYCLLDPSLASYYQSLNITTRIDRDVILITGTSFMTPYLPILLKINGKSVFTHEEILLIQKEWSECNATVICYYNKHPNIKQNKQLYDIILNGLNPRPDGKEILYFRRALSKFIPDLSARTVLHLVNNIPITILSQINYSIVKNVIDTLKPYANITVNPEIVNPEIQTYNTYIPEEGDVIHIHPIYVKLGYIDLIDEYSELIIRNILEYFNYTDEQINEVINDLPNNLPLIVAEVPDYEHNNIITMISEQSLIVDEYTNYLCVIGANAENDNSINFSIIYNYDGQIIISSSCKVIIESYYNNKTTLIKYIRTLTGLGLIEAKKFVENLPQTIREGLQYEEAVELADNIYNNCGNCTVRDENNNIIYTIGEN